MQLVARAFGLYAEKPHLCSALGAVRSFDRLKSELLAKRISVIATADRNANDQDQSTTVNSVNGIDMADSGDLSVADITLNEDKLVSRDIGRTYDYRSNKK